MTSEEALELLPAVDEELLSHLEWRYADPRCCQVCGAPLQLSDTRGPKYTCTSDAASPFKVRHQAAGATWQEALRHWEDSTLINPPDGDRRVLAVIAELRKLRGEK